ncbi:TPM domain-containing protein [Aquirhabdus parva]|uniref:TPM domain-containing protein n=1 Tax=Aquirhabdus parva TaxID=2283318 RepID=A0A345P3T3_9GAMM|nr:TPM domain-containing protein [Aquirhabdus parva]AXI01942.1 TPM domain-containing protein [Aquirhabdus parva]
MNARAFATSSLMRLYLLLLVMFVSMIGQSNAWAAEDDADAVIATQVAKTTALKPLKELVATPLATTAASAPVASTASTPAAVDAGGGFLTLPTLNAPVIDQAGALSAAENQQISDKLRAIHSAGRAQVGLILVKTTQGETIFDYAGRVFSAWKLGDAARDNGLLIVVAVQDRKMQILTGYGLEGIIPDVIASRIIREQITPQFKTGNYAAGLNAGIDRIDGILQQDPETAKAAADQLKAEQQAIRSGQQGNVVSGSLILILLVLVVVGQFTQMIFGRVLNSTGLAAAGVGVGLFSGLGLASSLLLGGGVFILLLVGILPFLNILLSMSGRGGGGSGGGGYGGGGGSFGGGGASGSW